MSLLSRVKIPMVDKLLESLEASSSEESIQQLRAELYGHHTFVGDGFKVVEKDGAYQVSQGVAIIGGLRVELKAPEVIHPGTKPIGVWVDVHRSGSLLPEHQNHFTIITSVADLTDHVDSNGYQHYVAKLGTILADSTIEDGRGSAGGGSGGAGSIPDTFSLWKRSMAEAGYDLIGQFGTALTIETAKQVVLSRDGQVAYSWAGSLPKEVSKDEKPSDSEWWVSQLGETLRSQLSMVHGASKIGTEDGPLSERMFVFKKVSPIEKRFAGGADPTGVRDSTDALEACINYCSPFIWKGSVAETKKQWVVLLLLCLVLGGFG